MKTASNSSSLANDPILQKIIEVIVNTVQPDKIILFGSRAKGTHSELSDYDLLILKSGIKPEDRRPLQRKVRRELWKKGILNVDIIIADPHHANILKSRWDLVYHDALTEGKTIYES